MPLFQKILVANRGEIAVRILRACRELGIPTVAVYSEPDADALHVQLADEAVLLGPAPSAESYLRIDRILDAARATGAEAIHPGYGFLAERAAFADAVEEAGFVFLGPPGATIRAMGDKTEARRRMQAAGVPIVPGLVDPLQDAKAAVEAAEAMGYPVLLKAAAGGGGKGMRVVHDSEALPRAFDAAGREALAAFGDGSVYLERYLERPRHIEIQVLGDTHGNVVHLHERECSVQRRHQKLVEEAPSPVLSPDERAAMGAAAVRAAETVSYRGAGTVEFLYQDGEFFFLEMNTRIQVEHPVTEYITGIDLVQWQIRVAAGERLAFDQSEIPLAGHSIECRITAEDPFHGFLPATGTVEYLEIPSGPGVRWDGGIAQGSEVGLNYDPLLGKLVVHAESRAAALDRLERALDELVIRGVETCLPFHRRIVRHPEFRSGDLSIRFLEEHAALLEPGPSGGADRSVAAVAATLLEHEYRATRSAPRIGAGSASGALPAWRASGWPWNRPL
jgi:acetyl-CoA carboxylase biotin carboxylase subunit